MTALASKFEGPSSAHSLTFRKNRVVLADSPSTFLAYTLGTVVAEVAIQFNFTSGSFPS
jgi:hypothetical protein